MTANQFHLIAYLFGPLYGLLWWTPVLFLGIFGSIWFAYKRPWPGGLFLLPLVLFISYNAGIADWDGGGGFGFRRILSLLPFFAVGLAAIFHTLQRWRLLPIVGAFMLSGWGMRIMLHYMDFKLFRAPDNFLDSLTVSMLSEQVMPQQALIHQISLSLFVNQLFHPTFMGIMVSIVLGLLTIGSYQLVRRIIVPLQ